MSGTKIHTVTPSDKVNIALANWADGSLSQSDLDLAIEVAVANGELAPTASRLMIMWMAATTYQCWHQVTEIIAQDMCMHEGLPPESIEWDLVQQWRGEDDRHVCDREDRICRCA